MIEPAIQIHPMVPLAKASAVLKISRDELIARLSAGELMGEKRRIGEGKRDSWFIYADEYNRLMSQAVAKYQERVSVKGLDHIFTPSSAPPPVPTPAVTPQTVAIEPTAVIDFDHEHSHAVDALAAVDAAQSEIFIGQTMVAQLVQHLQEERQTSDNLKMRLQILEEEVDKMRRDILGRPDQRSHNPVNRIVTYFRFLLGMST